MFPVERLHVRLARIQRPIAIVVGSALSVTRVSGTPNRGVPDVSAMIERIRSRMAAESLGEGFDESLRDGRGSKYQQALAYVQSTSGANIVDEIVREAVLEARLPGSPTLFDDDGDPTHWHLPRGTAALGRLFAADDSRFRGPILTTNFDPLLSMAIEQAGGKVDRRVLDLDGHLPGPGDSKHGVRVVHLHGYWRGATLHLPQHLTAPRPKLLGSLRGLLGGHTILVVAYGGWHDAFTQAFAQVLDQPGTAVEILWCLYGDEGTARHNNSELLDRFEPYPAFTPYYAVDAHELFEQLAASGPREASGTMSAPEPRSTKQPPTGASAPVPAAELDRDLARFETEHATVPLIGFQTQTRLSRPIDLPMVPVSPISQTRADVAVVIALKEEFRAFVACARARASFHQVRPNPEFGGDDHHFEIPCSTGGSYSLVATLVDDMGHGPAADTTHRLVSTWAPLVVMNLGIAASLDAKSLRLGDVLVVDQANGYLDKSKARPVGDGWEFDLGGDSFRSPEHVVKAVSELEFFSAGEPYQIWQSEAAKRLADAVPEEIRRGLEARRLLRTHPDIVRGHLASGPTVGAAAAFGQWLRDRGDRNIKALEMEAVGVMRAIGSRATDTVVLVLRGISDLGDAEKGKLDEVGDGVMRHYAMVNATEAMMHVLASGRLRRRQKRELEQAASPSLEPAHELAQLHEELERRVISGQPTKDVESSIKQVRREQRDGPTLQAGDILGDRYRLIEVAGKGGFATVWKAYDRERKCIVAAKILHGHHAEEKSRRDRFYRGAERMSKLIHPAVVPIIANATKDGSHHFFVMPWYDRDLRLAIARETIEPPAALRALARALEGLSHAHEYNLVHRDVKPGNILLDAEGQGLISDFDLVRAEDTLTLTQVGGVGTFLYAAPEQLQAGHDVDPSADIYGAGMCVIFVLTGQDPHPRQPLAQLRSCSPRLRALVESAIEYDRENRRTSCQDLIDGIRSFVDGRDVARVDTPASTSASDAEAPRGRSRSISGSSGHSRSYSGAVAGISSSGLSLSSDSGLGHGHSAAVVAGIVHHETGIEFVLIPAGRFLMGSPEKRWRNEEHPQHEVELASFYLAKTPVTNAQYAKYLADMPRAASPPHWSDNRYNQPDQPMVGVSWDEAQAYCDWAGLVLPTEAQWEYACRAGQTTEYWSGNGENSLAAVGWFRGNSDLRLHPVGQMPANPFGLRDMHGNIWEWCREAWPVDYNEPSHARDGFRPSGEGQFRVVRGGGWHYDASVARSAYRGHFPRSTLSMSLGFRPVMS